MPIEFGLSLSGPRGRVDDIRRLVVLYASECRTCPTWKFGPNENEDELYRAQHEHFIDKGHHSYYTYHIERGKSEVRNALILPP